MADANLHIQLEARTDANGRIFYFGKLKTPITIDCKDGIAIFVFTADSGCEEMQIGPLAPPKERVIKEFQRDGKSNG